MSFDGTTASLSSWTVEISVVHECELAALLRTYEQQLEGQNQESLSVGLLHEAETLLHARLQDGKFSAERVHLAVELYYHLQRWEALYQLLARYRRQPLPVYEEAWAWWTMNDCLALQRQCVQVMEQQQALLRWVQTVLPPDHWFFVLTDTTQALCWLAQAQQEQWYMLFTHLMAQIPPTATNREDRFLLVRTASHLALALQHHQHALTLIGWLSTIAREATDGERSTILLLEAQAMQMEVLASMQQIEQLRQIGRQAREHITSLMQITARLSQAQQRHLRAACHNLGAALYQAKQYDLAVPFFEQAITLGSTSAHTWLWLAASCWITSHDPTLVVPLLQQVRERDPNGTFPKQMAALSELHDLPDDVRSQVLGTL